MFESLQNILYCFCWLLVIIGLGGLLLRLLWPNEQNTEVQKLFKNEKKKGLQSAVPYTVLVREIIQFTDSMLAEKKLNFFLPLQSDTTHIKNTWVYTADCNLKLKFISRITILLMLSLIRYYTKLLTTFNKSLRQNSLSNTTVIRCIMVIMITHWKLRPDSLPKNMQRTVSVIYKKEISYNK